MPRREPSNIGRDTAAISFHAIVYEQTLPAGCQLRSARAESETLDWQAHRFNPVFTTRQSVLRFPAATISQCPGTAATRKAT